MIHLGVLGFGAAAAALEESPRLQRSSNLVLVSNQLGLTRCLLLVKPDGEPALVAVSEFDPFELWRRAEDHLSTVRYSSHFSLKLLAIGIWGMPVEALGSGLVDFERGWPRVEPMPGDRFESLTPDLLEMAQDIIDREADGYYRKASEVLTEAQYQFLPLAPDQYQLALA